MQEIRLPKAVNTINPDKTETIQATKIASWSTEDRRKCNDVHYLVLQSKSSIDILNQEI